MSTILYISDELYLSYKHISDFGIPIKTIEKWKKRSSSVIKKDGRSFVRYSSIPTHTRLKLPSEADLKAAMIDEATNIEVENIYKKLHYAQINHFSKHRKFYNENYGMDSELSFKTSMKRAVWDRLMELYKENKIGSKGGLKKGILKNLFSAYDRLYTGQYSCESAFSRAIKTLNNKGIDSVVVDKRLLGLNKPNQRFDERHVFFFQSVLSIGKAYTIPNIHEKVCAMCDEAGILRPSLSWIKWQALSAKNDLNIHNSRYGADVTDKITPYGGIIPALFADDQYQVDGWDMPFYYLGTDRNGNKRLKKLVLIAVKDACSKKIVGYSVSESENRISLFEALQNAVSQTNALPFEIVTDNHAYNETKEVGYLVEQAEKIGMTWTIDSNPKRKSIAERGFKEIGERFCKNHYGYIGQGIKTKDKDGRTKQELIDKYQKSGSILSELEIRAIAVDVVESFNNTPLKSVGKTPNQLYSESEKPKRFTLEYEDQLRLFSKRTEYTIRRAQINITVAGKKNEFQLPAELFSKLNNKTVAVRYEDLNTIYLFDLKTDRAIISLRQKERAHGALANQTEADIEIFNRHKGRLEGIKAQSRKNGETIAKKASDLDPRVFEIANRITTPKDVYKQAQEDADFRHALLRQGVDPNQTQTIKKESEIEIPAFKGLPQNRSEKSPMNVRGSKIEKITIEE